MRFLTVLTVMLAVAAGSASAAAPASITVVIKQPVQRVTIKLVPDYVLMLTFDRPIAAVGIGDDSLVATAVRETDLIMKALRPSGRTNLLVWAGDVRTVWEIVVNRAERTADIIQVITQPPTPPAPPPAEPSRESSTRTPEASPPRPVPDTGAVWFPPVVLTAPLITDEGVGPRLTMVRR
jgi:hypothetical protein